MDALSEDIKEFQKIISSKLTKEGIDHVFSLLIYMTMVLHKNNNALKNLYILGNACNIDVDVEILKLNKNDYALKRFLNLENYLNDEMTKFVASSINKFIINVNNYDLLDSVHKTKFEMTLSIYDPIRIEFFNLKNNDIHKYEDYYEDFDPDLPFYELPYYYITEREFIYYIIDANHFGKFSFDNHIEFYSEKTSIIHKYSFDLIKNFEKKDEKEKKDIFLILLTIAHICKNFNKHSFKTLRWFFRNYNEIEDKEKIFNLYEHKKFPEELNNDIIKSIREKIISLKSSRILVAILDTFVVPINNTNKISVGNLDENNKKMLLDYTIFPLIEILHVYKDYHNSHITKYKNSTDSINYKLYVKSNNIRLWFLIENSPKLNSTKIREVDFWYRNTYIDIAKENKTFCLLNEYHYKYLDSEEIFEDSQKSLIYQFANEIYIEYELLNKDIANLVFQIVLLTAKQFNCINNRVFESLYHVFKPSSDIQWTEMINMMMNFENDLRNNFNKLNNSKPNDEEIIESLIKKEVENGENVEFKKLNEMCKTLFGSNDFKAKTLCSVIIDTFVLSFEMQNSLNSNYTKKISSNETLNLNEIICNAYHKNTCEMQKFVENYLIADKTYKIMAEKLNIPSSDFGAFCFRLQIFTIKKHNFNFNKYTNEILINCLKKIKSLK